MRALFLGLALLAGCSGTTAVGACSEDTPCTGFGEVCIRGECVVGTCTTNADCPIENRCTERECEPGCDRDNDCYPGSSCDTELHECVEDACEETRVDCGYREFCNTLTGDCYDAGEQYCRPCTAGSEDQDCGQGNECIGGFCGVDCADGRACPGGFECYSFSDSAGNIVAYQCWTYCWLYDDYEPGQDPVTAVPDLPGSIEVEGMVGTKVSP
ncbi:MAG: hypothetical protein EP330_10050 [Deltaproteobacteria bacterium]|nr:MAG: hypothetical protein EP330_10050 [Deltaproteobacteria bacterium]